MRKVPKRCRGWKVRLPPMAVRAVHAKDRSIPVRNRPACMKKGSGAKKAPSAESILLGTLDGFPFPPGAKGFDSPCRIQPFAQSFLGPLV